jgi:ankyrin repeat protein
MPVRLRKRTELADAVLRSDAGAVRRLLAEGQDPNEHDEHGLTPLFLAVAPFGGDLTMVKLLVEAGADVNARSPEGHDLARYCLDGVSSALEHGRAMDVVRVLEASGLRRR